MNRTRVPALKETDQMRGHRPSWKTILLAEAAGISQVTLVYDRQVVDPFRTGGAFPNLATCGFLLERTMFSPLGVGPVKAGWREFGLFGNRAGTEWSAGPVRGGMTAWAYILEWNPVRSAWEALLDGQETLNPERLSLAPDFLLPSLFLARMADVAISPGLGNTGAAWVPCMARAHQRLLPLICALVAEWMGGSSQAASRYRRLTGGGWVQSEAHHRARRWWQQVFGSDLLRRVHTVERIEPTIMRGLEAASVRLWTDRTLEIAVRRQGWLSALLPIARWQPVPPGPAVLEASALASLETLLQAWKGWRAAGG